MSRRGRSFEQRYYYRPLEKSDRMPLKPVTSNIGAENIDASKSADMQVGKSQ